MIMNSFHLFVIKGKSENNLQRAQFYKQNTAV